MPDTPGRVRATRGLGDVKKFLRIGTMEEVTEFRDRLAKDKNLLVRFGTVRSPSSSSASRRRRGLPPRIPINGRSFLLKLDQYIAGKVSKERLIEEWISVGEKLGRPSPFIGGVWDELPAAYKSVRVVRGPGSPQTKNMGGGGKRRTRKAKPVAGFAVVHSAEKPWVKEPNYQRWLKKLKRHTAKVRRHGDDPNPMNMCLDSAICKGDLGIPRKLMPQFTSPRDIRSFTDFIGKRYGIKAVRGTRRAGQLRPSQEEIHRERVEDVKEDIVAKKPTPNAPLIVSEDGYVIDGHHRWAAYKSHEPGKKMPVLIVKDSARDVLSMAATWGAKHHQF